MRGDFWDVVGCGFAGWHAARPGTSSTGGTFAGYFNDAKEGALIYDARHLEGTPLADAFVAWVFKGPMLDTALAPNDVDSFKVWPRQPRPYVRGENLGGLDSVGVEVYIELLMTRVPGIKIGFKPWHRGCVGC